MGGQLESTVQDKGKDYAKDPSAAKVKGQSANIQGAAPPPPEEIPANPAVPGSQALRIHENNGEIHFHADALHMKVAVPVAEWWKAWQRLWNPFDRERWVWVDKTHNTRVKVETVVVPQDDGTDLIELFAEVRRYTFGPTYQAMERFSNLR
jgi:hypothetical protein